MAVAPDDAPVDQISGKLSNLFHLSGNFTRSKDTPMLSFLL